MPGVANSTYQPEMTFGGGYSQLGNNAPPNSIDNLTTRGTWAVNDMKQIRVHGQDRRYHHPIIGINGRIDTLQGAVLLAKFDSFPHEIKARAQAGGRYDRLLAGAVVTPYVEPHNTSVYAQYTLQVDDREKVQAELKQKGIPTAVHYPVPLHLQPAFAALGHREGDFPVAEAAAKRVLSLPMHPYISEAEQKLVADAVLEATALKASTALAR